MLRKLLPIGTLLLFAIALVILPQADAHADRSRHHNQYTGHQLPPGLQMLQGNWIPPGQLKKMQRSRDYDHGRYDCDRNDRRYRDDRRYQDTRSYRHEPPKYKRYDRDSEEYGLIIRNGPRGTTVEVEYHKRDR